MSDMEVELSLMPDSIKQYIIKILKNIKSLNNLTGACKISPDFLEYTNREKYDLYGYNRELIGCLRCLEKIGVIDNALNMYKWLLQDVEVR